MEVEARVSVQAIKGRFEQLYEDCPLPPTSHRTTPAPAPVRPRTASLSKNQVSRSVDVRKTNSNLLHSAKVNNQNRTDGMRPRGFSTGDTSNPSLFFSTVTNSPSATPRKHSSNLRDNLERKTSESCLHGAASQDLKQNTRTKSTDVKPSVVRRIPVFKSFDTKLNSDSKKFSTEVNDESIEESQGIRGRFFTHIRSRSHGNFNMKRDPSGERNCHGRDKNGNIQKENVFNKDWLTPKRKQRSTDDLLDNHNSYANSTFEGKQKIVANVVKNMKNKDKPIVLKKLSFSSKIEKELKNMKEKSTNSESKENKSRKIFFTDNNIKGKHKTCSKTACDTPIYSKKGNMQCKSPNSAIASVAIARAVADIALKKSGTVSTETNDSSSSCEDNLAVPPSRPPRRRSGSHTSPRKKGKAPSPPDHSVSPAAQRHTMHEGTHEKDNISDEDKHDTGIINTDGHLGLSCSPCGSTQRPRHCPTAYRSTESLLSSNSADKSREGSPVMMTHGNSLSFSDIAGGPHVMDCKRSPTEQKNTNHDRHELQSIPLNNVDKPSCIVDKSCQDINNDKTEVQELPVGPPPRKPPRTFAYDIYKNFKPTEHKDPPEKNDIVKENSKSEICSPPPIYAVPKKKKTKNNNFIPKPPIRSKSDLSNKDETKPSVAPKPPHILAKAKRASLVDPLSNNEREEEAALTSEFQRQAHVRYSLRRPGKPPPTPPLYAESKLNDVNYLKITPNNSSDCQNDSSCSINNRCNEHEKEYYPQTETNPIEYHNIEQEHRTSKSPELRKRPHSNSFLLGLNGIRHEDFVPAASPIGTPSFSAHNLQTPSTVVESEHPMSLGYCFVSTPSPETAGLFKKRSMSDETLYKGSRRCDEPVYATPMFNNTSDSSDHNSHRELHYMCSVLFTDEEDEGGGAGRDGGMGDGRARRSSKDKIIGTEAGDEGKGRTGIINAWKREFRQSCRQVQNKIKKTVIR